MFKINPAPTFKAAIKITVPGGDPKAITFEFKHRTRTGLAEWIKNMSGKEDRALVSEFVAGWSGVIGEDGLEVPYTLDAFMQLAENYPAASMEVYAGYVEALTESRTKN